MCSVSAELVQCCDNTALLKSPINTGLPARLVQCAVFLIKYLFSVKFVLKSQQIHTTTCFFLIFALSNLAELTNEARAETQARLGYALQEGGRAEGSTAHKWAEASKTHKIYVKYLSLIHI